MKHRMGLKGLLISTILLICAVLLGLSLDLVEAYPHQSNVYISTENDSFNEINPRTKPEAQTGLDSQVTDPGGLFNAATFQMAAPASQWIPTALSMYDIGALAIDPSNSDVVYATSTGGFGKIFKTINGGGSWPENYSDSTLSDSLAIDPANTSTVYAGRWHRVLKTIDGGVNWDQLPLFTSAGVVALAIDPNNIANLYAGVEYGWGVYKSINGGQDWSRVLESTFATSLAIDPTDSNVIFTGAKDGYGLGGGVYKSSDSGDNWTKVMSNVHVTSLAISPVNSNTVYAGTEGDGVMMSTDGGENWTNANTGMTNSNVQALVIDPMNSCTIYAGTDSGGIFRSDDGGSGWNSINEGLTNTDIGSLAIAADASVLFAGSAGGGVFRRSPDTRPEPAICSLPDQSLSVNASRNNAIDLWAHAGDAETADSDLTFSISNSPAAAAGVTIDSNRYIDINPAPGWSGSTNVTIQVQDSGGLTDTDTFQVTIAENKAAYAYLPYVVYIPGPPPTPSPTLTPTTRPPTATPTSTPSSSHGIDGNWAGTTAQGRPISFVIQNRAITSISFSIQLPYCTVSGTVNFSGGPKISGNTFEISWGGYAPGQDKLTLKGQFSSDNSASGTLTNEGSNCGDRTVSWTATK